MVMSCSRLRESALILSDPASSPSRLAPLAPQDEDAGRRRTLAPRDEDAGETKGARTSGRGRGEARFARTSGRGRGEAKDARTSGRGRGEAKDARTSGRGRGGGEGRAHFSAQLKDARFRGTSSSRCEGGEPEPRRTRSLIKQLSLASPPAPLRKPRGTWPR